MAPEFLKLSEQKVYRFFPRGPMVTARERADLPPDQQRRWDYFYRPDPAVIFGFRLDEFLKAEKEQAELSKALSEAKARQKINWLLTGLVWVALLVILLGVSMMPHTPKSNDTLVAVGVVGAIIAVCVTLAIHMGIGRKGGAYAGSVWELEGRLQSVDKRLKELRELRNDLMAQLTNSPPPPTDEEMLEFWNKNLEMLEKKAMEECNVSPSDLLDREHRIRFTEWGCLQDQSRSGYKMLDNYRERHQALAITRTGVLLYCSNYVEFIFLTDKNIDIYGTFFDMIEGDNLGEHVVTFYYQHVTNVQTEVDVVNLDFLGTDRQEAMSIILRVSSGDAVRVTLTDESIQQQIGAWANEDSPEIDSKLTSLRAELERAEDEDQKKGIKKRIERLEARRGPATLDTEIDGLKEQLAQATEESQKLRIQREINALVARRAPMTKKMTVRAEDTRGKARTAVRTIRSRILEMQKLGRRVTEILSEPVE